MGLLITKEILDTWAAFHADFCGQAQSPRKEVKCQSYREHQPHFDSFGPNEAVKILLGAVDKANVIQPIKNEL